jgi:hypothetical protein
MRLLLLALGAWAAWRIAEENGMLDHRRQTPAPVQPLPAQKPPLRIAQR